MKRTLAMLTVCSAALLGGCSTQELSEMNQTVSDVSSDLTSFLTGGRIVREDRKYDVLVPVDVDTAAARLRRYYNFEDVDAKIVALKNSGRDSDSWKATALAGQEAVWEAAPGSFYKMGKNYGDLNPPNRIVIELEKNGAGSMVYVTYSSSYRPQLNEQGVSELFQTVHDVAVGKVR
ncbi:hypothetical protein FXF61_00385 [Pseudomonas sp. C27(2019)]|uniref:hypothetical protein n=1 Tax=Pseudomonas sp. C27(2019) TaxID=2604941 RepID=UPI0012451793|nr:hypothetical protein [Pseudomonas sp. C27(2019)]MDY0250859.1 hypothetical protein [Pseudomonas sp.]QEY57728.1 hypothetical protein FXF61_00385 [Pseudomonas sp. C27(2019)]